MTRFIFSALATILFSVLFFPKRLIPLITEIPFSELVSLLSTGEVIGFVFLFSAVYLFGPAAMKLIDMLEQKFKGN